MKSPIAIAIEKAGMTHEQVASALGVSRQAVQRWASGNSPTLSNLKKLAELLNASVSTLSGDDVVVIDAKGRPVDSNVSMDDLVLIPVLDVYGSCGGGSDGEITSRQSDSALQLVGVKSSTPQEWPGVTGTSRLHIIHVTGDSMEPTLKRGADIIVDGNQTAIDDDGIFVLRAEGQTFIKRVQRNIDGSITLISDNPLYNPQTVPRALLESVTVSGRVLVQMNMSLV